MGDGEAMMVVAIIQARMTSKRLPGKVLKDIHGKTVLQMVVERVKMAQRVNKVVVATSTDPSDDPVEAACSDMDVACIRGNLHDVLARFGEAAHAYPADAYVRITADCPLLDPELVDAVIDVFERQGVAYASNQASQYRTYPIGLDVEVFMADLLWEAVKHAELPYQREHVTPYMYDGSVDVARYHLTSSVPESGSMRWTLDTPEDLEFVRAVIGLLDHGTTQWHEILTFVRTHPDLSKINNEVRQKSFQDVEL